MKMMLGLCRTGFSASSPESSQGLMLWADPGKDDPSANVSRITNMDQYLEGDYRQIRSTGWLRISGT
jgi:hypothetical protein